MVSDDTAILRARIMRDFDALLNAALAQLRLYYAARITGLLLVARSDRAAAVAALMNERDAALAELEHSIRQRRRGALMAARRRVIWKRRYRVCFEPFSLKGSARPQASHSPALLWSRHHHPKP